MYLETIDEKAFRSFLSNPAISVLDGNVLDKHHNSNFYRFVRVPLSDGEHSVEALFGQMCSNYPTSMALSETYLTAKKYMSCRCSNLPNIAAMRGSI